MSRTWVRFCIHDAFPMYVPLCGYPRPVAGFRSSTMTGNVAAFSRARYDQASSRLLKLAAGRARRSWVPSSSAGCASGLRPFRAVLDFGIDSGRGPMRSGRHRTPVPGSSDGVPLGSEAHLLGIPHIRSGAEIPSNPRPSPSVLPVRSHRTSLLERTSPSARSTGQFS